MKNFTPEMIEKAKAAKTAEELMALAKENEIEMTEDEAKAYVAQLNPVSGELADDELDNVAGGCGGSDSSTPVSTEPERKIYQGIFWEGALVTGPYCSDLLHKMNNSWHSCGSLVKNNIHFNNEWDWEIDCPKCGQHFHFSERPQNFGFRLAEE